MKIVITGANGFVGSELAGQALACGCQVTAVTRKAWHKPGCENLILGHYGLESLTTALQGVDVVVHLAGKAHQPGGNTEQVRRDYFRINRDNTQLLARAARNARVRRFIFLSSIKVNGEQTLGHAFRADDPPNPQDIYGESKLAAETALKDVFRN